MKQGKGVSVSLRLRKPKVSISRLQLRRNKAKKKKKKRGGLKSLLPRSMLIKTRKMIGKRGTSKILAKVMFSRLQNLASNKRILRILARVMFSRLQAIVAEEKSSEYWFSSRKDSHTAMKLKLILSGRGSSILKKSKKFNLPLIMHDEELFNSWHEVSFKHIVSRLYLVCAKKDFFLPRGFGVYNYITLKAFNFVRLILNDWQLVYDPTYFNQHLAEMAKETDVYKPIPLAKKKELCGYKNEYPKRSHHIPNPDNLRQTKIDDYFKKMERSDTLKRKQ